MGKILELIEQNEDIEQSTSSDNIKSYMRLVKISEEIENRKKDLFEKMTTEEQVKLALVKPNVSTEQNVEKEKSFLSVTDVSSILGVSPQMVRRYCQERKLIAQQRFNGQWFIEEEQFSTDPKLIPYWKRFCEKEDEHLKLDKEIATTILDILDKEDAEDK